MAVVTSAVLNGSVVSGQTGGPPSAAFEVEGFLVPREPTSPVGSSGEATEALCASWLLLFPVALGSATMDLFIPLVAGALLGSPMPICFSNVPPF